MKFRTYNLLLACLLYIPFKGISQERTSKIPTIEVFPEFKSDTVSFDTDDPAIYYNRKNPAKSLIIGTDKGGKTGQGGIFVFDILGKNIEHKNLLGINRPNNIDVAYGLLKGKSKIDIAVCTERNTNKIRVIKLPEMQLIDGGGIDVFQGEIQRSPMGIALFTDAKTNKIYAIVSRKDGPSQGYLFQYLLEGSDSEIVTGKLVRKFGQYSGLKEIESIAVDNELGFVYYSDETVGVRKYYAHPDSSGRELALFAKTGFKEDHEGISIYKTSAKKGFILVSDQQANQFHVFRREGEIADMHKHELIKILKTQTNESDGSEITGYKLNRKFKNGLFVAMSNDKTFHFYSVKNFFNEELN
jgi:3-phytase